MDTDKGDLRMKKLTKSRNRMVCGVCSGIAEYFGWDPTWVRLGWALFTCFAGTGLLAYIIAAVVMPAADSVDS